MNCAYNLIETSVPSLRLVSTSSRPLCFESTFSNGFKSCRLISGIWNLFLAVFSIARFISSRILFEVKILMKRCKNAYGTGITYLFPFTLTLTFIILLNCNQYFVTICCGNIYNFTIQFIINSVY